MFVGLPGMAPDPRTVEQARVWMRRTREAHGWSTTELANRARGIAAEQGSTMKLTQQSVSGFETKPVKRLPEWFRYVEQAFEAAETETAEDPPLGTGKTDTSVMIKLLPTFAGMGAGGTGEGDEGRISFSRDLIENELRIPPAQLLAMVAEGNSMEPDFRGGDQILVDTRRRSLAQPGAFCLWDGDGHVIKFLQKVQGSEPQKVRVISANGVYEPEERLLDEINLIGRVVWFGRRVQ
jgi:phage repressor protein C with HTH and peptisase S24 domain